MDCKVKWSWEIANSPEEVHKMLLDSDRQHYEPNAKPFVRNFEKTARLVNGSAVYFLRFENHRVAMFTLTKCSPFCLMNTGYEQARLPVYLQRLVVTENAPSLSGFIAIRKAMELGVESNADFIRCEVNPRLTKVYSLFKTLGFNERASTREIGNHSKAYLEYKLNN